jgi:uncharacterized membrane protein YsdA (DUF1294 family)/cold shock CspA family protein
MADERQHGVLTDWNDARGFGFIRDVRGRRLFAHVSEFPRGRRPADGHRVSFVAARDERNRMQATGVRYVGNRPTGSASGSALRVAIVVAASFFAVLAGLVALGDLPLLVAAAYGVLSVVALGLYGADKSAAEQRHRRTPESTLHLVALLGGWPGAMVARPLFRHKTRKQPFRTIFWLTAMANAAALVWLVVVTR